MSGGGNGYDAAAADVLGAERAYQEKRFGQVIRALQLASDPRWRADNAHIIEALRRLPGGDR